MVERFLSPFYYYAPADALVSGTVPPGSLAVFLAVFLVGVSVTGWLLVRRGPARGVPEVSSSGSAEV